MIHINKDKVTDNKGRDISASLLHYLFEDVDVQSFTLQDLFSLMESNPILKEVYRLNFAYELCAEAVQGPSQNAIESNWRRRNPKEEDLEYIELYDYEEFNSRTKEKNGGDGFMNMHAVSFPLTQDSEEYGFKQGERIPFSVSLTPVRDLLLLPIRINYDVTVHENDTASKSYGKKLSTFKKESISLGRLFEAVLWEISFHGVSNDKEDFIERIQNSLNEIKDGDLSLESEFLGFTEMDDADIFYEIGANEFDQLFSVTGTVSDWVKNKIMCTIKEVDDEQIIDHTYLLSLVHKSQEEHQVNEQKMIKFDVKASFERVIESIDFKADFISICGKTPTAIALRAFAWDHK